MRLSTSLVFELECQAEECNCLIALSDLLVCEKHFVLVTDPFLAKGVLQWKVHNTSSAPLLTTKSQWKQCISLGMRRIFESTFEPSHGFQPNCPWYGKNGMEGKKSLLCADVKALSIELASFYLERNNSLVWESSFTHYSSPLKKAIENLENLNKNAEVSVPQGSPLSLFFSQHHQPHFSPWMGQSQKSD